jgi:hypothetical protein
MTEEEKNKKLRRRTTEERSSRLSIPAAPCVWIAWYSGLCPWIV